MKSKEVRRESMERIEEEEKRRREATHDAIQRLDSLEVSPEELVKAAREAVENAYRPYSDYAVGAAGVTSEGEIVTGVNIENITLDMCSHAERTVLKKIISSGEQMEALAISTQGRNGPPPCGSCRQYIAEFCEDSVPLVSDDGDDWVVYSLREVYPHPFRPQDVEEQT